MAVARAPMPRGRRERRVAVREGEARQRWVYYPLVSLTWPVARSRELRSWAILLACGRFRGNELAISLFISDIAELARYASATTPPRLRRASHGGNWYYILHLLYFVNLISIILIKG